MTTFEVVKQFMFPSLEVWQSSAATVIFSTAIALLCASVLFDKSAVLYSRQKETEQALRKNEERFRKSQVYANIGTWDWDIQTGELYWSEQIAPLFGYEQDKVETTYENFVAAIHPDDRDKVAGAVQASVDDPHHKYEIDHRVVWADGTVRWLHEKGEVVRADDGTPLKMLGVVSDITERNEAERNLRKLSRALEQSPSAVFITDIEGIIEYVNPTFTSLTGYSEQEAIGQNPRLIKSDATPKEVHSDIWRTIRAGGEWRGELQDTHKNGSHFWAYATIAPIRDAKGTITHFVATHEDISQRKNAEAAIQDALEHADVANRAKSELLANMSHELRTPLNAIIGFSSCIKEETFGPIGNEKYGEYINDISSSGQHLLDLINDILDVSAIEAGKLELHEDLLEIDRLVDAAVRLVRHRADDENVSLQINIDYDLPELYADERRMKQILLNLLTNAVKFTPPGGRVSLHAALADDGGLGVTIADTGIGMTESELLKAMTQFGQVGRGDVAKHEGTGLGLPLTKELVELHNGSMEITSEKGIGTTINLKFPRERVIVNFASAVTV